MKRIKGFTLTEVIITMVLVITLALISMPLYKGRYSNKAKIAEGYALLGAIKDAQFNYYNEYGYFLAATHSFAPGVNKPNDVFTMRDPVLGVNAVNNNYFTAFNYHVNDAWNQGNPPQYTYMFIVNVRSAKAGTIIQTFNLTQKYKPSVINGSTDLSF
ncbi:MAG: hypothetical protein II816_07095 [Elusimicrobia bacterium]|nr:hypothetical protein [Elusimicrobiota bacterium]